LNVLLGGDSDHVRWNVDHLLSNGDVSLSDKDSGMMQRFGETSAFSNASLQSSLHELVDARQVEKGCKRASHPPGVRPKKKFRR
jgi:hypothetical protein